MLEMSTFDRLEPGDRIELPGLFRGLTGEPLRLLVVSRDGQRLKVEGSYFGVPIGRWVARVRDGAVEWRALQPEKGR